MDERDAIARFLDDAPISQAKRRKLDREIREALINNPSLAPDALFQFLGSINLVDLPFIDLWHLIQVFPPLIKLIWTNKHFRARMEFEFNDVYRSSINRLTNEMDDDLREELWELSTKTSSRVYPKEEDGPPSEWALLYQRCKRMMLLSKEVAGRHIFQNLTTLDHVSLYYNFAAREEEFLAFEECSANGSFVATPVIRGRIVAFVIVDWANKPDRGETVLRLDDFIIVRSNLPYTNGNNFAITQTGKLAYLVTNQEIPGEGFLESYLEVYDAMTYERTPGNDKRKIAKAIEFCNDAWQATDRTLSVIKPVAASSMIMVALKKFEWHVDLDTYFDFLQGRRTNVKHSTAKTNHYLQNNWTFNRHTDERSPEDFYHVVEKDDSVAPGAEPVWNRVIYTAIGPFFSISRKQPLRIFGLDENGRYSALPVGTSVFSVATDGITVPFFQSSMFIVELMSEQNRLKITHPAGFTTIISLHDSAGPATIVSIVGYKILILFNLPAHTSSYRRHCILNLEECFIANGSQTLELIRAPCRTCSLPSIAYCGGKSCKMPYCGKECQKEDWLAHSSQCRN
jgi:hypothetical protein